MLYDYLVNPQILEHAPPGAELVCLGRHGRDASCRSKKSTRAWSSWPAPANAWCGSKGATRPYLPTRPKRSRRLQPPAFDYEIVPGITAALAVGSYAGIPLTQGDAASAVALVTGQEREDKQGRTLDYPALAAFPGTLVFYMGVTTARALERGADRCWQVARHAGGDRAPLLVARPGDDSPARSAAGR